MRTPVRKVGNSAGIAIPKSVLAQVGVEVGDNLVLSLDDGRIVLVAAKQPPRAGWADAAKQLTETGDDARGWPEFGNAGDASLKR